MHATTLLTMVLSALSVFLMKNWMMVWIMMELNMVSLIFMASEEKKKETLMLLFLFQSMASMSLLVFLMLKLNPSELKVTPLLILMAMMMKMGMFPLHSWLLTTSKKLSWNLNVILMTWQKMIPTFILMKSLAMSVYTTIFVVTMISSSAIMLQIFNIKKLMATSSLVHMSWMLLAMNHPYWFSTVYLLLYSIIMAMMFSILSKKNLSLFYQQSAPSKIPHLTVLCVSLSGIPPLMGFVMKMMVFYSLMKMINMNISLIFIFIAASIGFMCYSHLIIKPLMEMSKSDMMENPLKVKSFFSSKIFNISIPTTALML